MAASSAEGDATPLVELRDFRYTYLAGTPRAVDAVFGVSLRIRAGERVAIVGASQAGKSTIIDAFAHLLRLTPGQVFHRGQDITAPGYDRVALRREVGIVFQLPDEQIIEDVVGKDVAFGPTAAGLPVEETRQRVEESLEAVGLPYREYRLRYVHALSGGQRRRVALAGVLAMHTPLLVLDEPMAGLDPKGRREILALLLRLREERGLTLVVASSSLADAALLCERIVVLRDGRVVMDGPVEEIVTRTDELVDLEITLPEATLCARELRAVFPDLPAGILTEDQLERALLERLGGIMAAARPEAAGA